MKIRLDGEDGRKLEEGSVAPASAFAVSLPQGEQVRLANLERLQALIDQAMTGSLPRDRELRDWEPDKLSPVHVQMILDRASGLSQKEISEKHEYDPGRVSVVLSHPDSQLLLSTILSMSADKVTTIQERLKHLAPEALNVKVEVMRLSKNDRLRDSAASDILALAGYGGRGVNVNINSNNQTNNRATLQLPAQAATGLVEALKEAAKVSGMDYSQYLRGATKGDEIAAEHKQLSDGLAAGTGHTSGQEGASPFPSPDPVDADFEVTGWSASEKDAEEVARALVEEEEAELERRMKTA